ncbi:lipid-binding SYLF domain-containing protein [Campylobacter lanienae]|uniref:lipid-binding SYLF domain-containing protein n=1 Tax=Campylobacter lanienae TaxID=75658 RepID=UPI002A912694|nr:lipid-binding SYLF domain-containing protein [Campylobacter lanienae]MDY6135124.1 lipid-binding SYLF domain-containing protein [Campylobacter lanienae]
MRKIIWLIFLSLGLYGGDERFLDSSNAYNIVNRTNQISSSIITNASAIIVFPTFVKAGFILGATVGRGVMIVRDESANELIDDRVAYHQNSVWSVVPVRLGGVTIGLQVGYENNFIVMYLMNRGIIKDIYDNKFTLNAGTSVSFMDHSANIGTMSDIGLSDIYVFTNNSGFFAGANLGGSVITVDDKIKVDPNSYGYKQLIQAISVIR